MSRSKKDNKCWYSILLQFKKIGQQADIISFYTSHWYSSMLYFIHIFNTAWWYFTMLYFMFPKIFPNKLWPYLITYAVSRYNVSIPNIGQICVLSVISKSSTEQEKSYSNNKLVKILPSGWLHLDNLPDGSLWLCKWKQDVVCYLYFLFAVLLICWYAK